MRTLGDVSSRAVAITSGQLVDADPNRVTLMFAAPANGQVTLAPRPGVVLGAGLNLNQGNPAIILRVQEFGDLVTKRWDGIASVATTIGIGEASYVD